MGMAASGIYGGVKLLAFDTAVLSGVHVQQYKSGDEFVLGIESQLLVPPAGDAGTIWVALPELGITDKIRLTLDGTLQEVRVLGRAGGGCGGCQASMQFVPLRSMPACD